MKTSKERYKKTKQILVKGKKKIKLSEKRSEKRKMAARQKMVTKEKFGKG